MVGATGNPRWAKAGHDVVAATDRPERSWSWWIALGLSSGLVVILLACLAPLLYEGVGFWGNNIPVTWALDIASYDWWIGIACGGLFVSAMLLLLGVRWRGAINRLIETVTLLAACAAGIYPIIHLGRPWFFYWNLPYPNTLLLWPQFRSPLYWDAVDIISLLGVAAATWYVGLLPDLAAMRDRAIVRTRQQDGRPGHQMRRLGAQLYGIAAMGWHGSVIHWQRWEQACRTLAVFGILVVIALQTGAAVMFAGTPEPGWHDTLHPVAFLLEALFAGVGAVAVYLTILRAAFGLQGVVGKRELELIALLLLGLSLGNFYCYVTETLNTLLTGNAFDKSVLSRHWSGPHGFASWVILCCALLPAQLFWIRLLRRSALLLCVVGFLVTAGIYASHFRLIVITLQQDFLPSSAAPYSIRFTGVGTFLGTAGLFLFLLLLAIRFLPMFSIEGIKRMMASGSGGRV